MNRTTTKEQADIFVSKVKRARFESLRTSMDWPIPACMRDWNMDGVLKNHYLHHRRKEHLYDECAENPAHER